jgi:hypothetical protein
MGGANLSLLLRSFRPPRMENGITQAKAWAWSLAIFLSRERSAARFFSLSGGLEHQIQGGGPNGEARHGLGILLTLFAQQANEIQ